MSKDNNLFIENCLIIINEDGTVTKVPRVLQERNHKNAFFRLNKENPSALTYFPWEELYHCDGYEFANYVAAIGKVIFWPSDINNPENMIVTLPQVPENIQGRQVENIFPALEEFSVYACTTHFRKPRSPKIVTTPLCSSGDFEETYNKVKNYLSISAMLNEPEHIENVNLVGKAK